MQKDVACTRCIRPVSCQPPRATRTRGAPSKMAISNDARVDSLQSRGEQPAKQENLDGAGYENMQEVELKEVLSADEIEGHVPTMLHGLTYVMNGPAVWDFKKFTLRHWFDGLGALRKFSFEADGSVLFHAKSMYPARLRTWSEASKADMFTFGEKRGEGGGSLFEFAKRAFSTIKYSGGDVNVNVNTARIRGKDVLLTDAPILFEYDLESMERRGRLKLYSEYFEKRIPMGVVGSAHPLVDPETGEYIAIYQAMGGKHVIISIPGEKDNKASVIAEVQVGNNTFCHSFFITRQYVVLAIIPAYLDVGRMISRASYVDALRFEASDPSLFYVVDRQNGELKCVYEHDAFFFYHTVNAFERGDDIVLNVCHYEAMNGLDGLDVENLRSGEVSYPKASLMEYTLTDVGKRPRAATGRPRAEARVVGPVHIDMPCVNDKFRAREYRFAYGISREIGETTSLSDRLVKVDRVSGECVTWKSPFCYPDEPLFVPASADARREDDGVLLSIVHDGARKQSFLLILDASSMTELARCYTSAPIPHGFHGQMLPSHNPLL
ncbi:Beta,beta-carotene 9',10'-oxygenase [Porphyridium purpureum]|uniref:Beta,beta-carotene 9',10'-oxygenase n=1 Tax=Porphyridium purpureum TaxID=35688 RepID=A0A5J4Z346_PORPP|nr:Beta,beta-carotene 9',10'-oxygenase [Porphyridium purpureum]|eukprot:POR2755..scf295_1